MTIHKNPNNLMILVRFPECDIACGENLEKINDSIDVVDLLGVKRKLWFEDTLVIQTHNESQYARILGSLEYILTRKPAA